MVRDLDPYKLSSPQVYLWRMLIFLGVLSFIPLILYRPILQAFQSNPLLNSLIILVAILGIALAFVQVVRLFREVNWVNGFRRSEQGLELERPPVLLAPMAVLLGNKIGDMALTPQTMRSLLDSIATRLDEARELGRYLTGLLVFLGLLGTFWGLLQTVSAVGGVIQSLDVGNGDTNVIFEDLKAGLEAPLAGMGTAFSSSLFGLTGSLLLGFLELQAGQAQSRFYNELEDWLSTVTEIEIEDVSEPGRDTSHDVSDLRIAIDQLRQSVTDSSSAGSSRATSQAMANLAEGIQGLVQHVRTEQKMMREWAESQADQQKRIETLLENLTTALGRGKD
ncbi:flagellar motor protein MotA [Breoghania sp. L-A4]|uniref:flagellar motor protein MotA n=1 Tax=Breoghania sp. L-A4 TaxID=2304600 RepID=UPI000E35B2ED|nr:flagellar motor protein MotA [Breoghania sp. L-A4]AXS42748.1 flagellar motor protein MotA [Breoghania sp. L-A4]